LFCLGVWALVLFTQTHFLTNKYTMFSPTYIDLYAKSRCGKVEAFQELVRMSNEGDKMAKGYRAMILQRSSVTVIPKNKPQAIVLLGEIMEWLFQIEHDDVFDAANSWYLLGFCYYEAIGVEQQDKMKAVHYYKLAFEKNHALAQCALGNCYDVGDGVKQNIPKALSYYELSADQGFPVAQSNVGMCYEYGEGCTIDLEKAIRYATLAAEQGYVDALYNLSMYYFYGKGVPLDPARGVQYCQQGADLGDLECLYILGDCYMRGCDVRKDTDKGFQLLLSAANRHHDLSQIYVAECYHKGQGVAVNIIEAVRYLRRAAENRQTDSDHICLKDDLEESVAIANELLKEYQEEYQAQVNESLPAMLCLALPCLVTYTLSCSSQLFLILLVSLLYRV
jgi:TPR repeat protein